MAAPTVRSRAVGSNGGNSTTVTVPKPFGTTEDDLLVMIGFAHEGGLDFDFSLTGWTHITHPTPRTGSMMCALWKWAGSSEGASYTFDNNIPAGGDDCILTVIAIVGADPASPIASWTDTETVAGGGNGDPPASNTVTSGDYLALAIIGSDDNTEATVPSGYTEVLSVIDSGDGMTLAVGSLAATGVTSVNPGAFVSGAGDYIAATLLIKGDVTSLTQGRPDADVTTTGWSSTPLWSKIEESSPDGTVISATAA